MSLSNIRLEKEEKRWISTFAKMNGITFSDQVRQWTLERLVDELDAHDLADAIEHDDGKRISWSEVKRDLRLK